MSRLLATAVAAKALKKDNSSMQNTAPKTIQESIFSKPLTWALIAGAAIYFGSRLVRKIGKKGSIIETKQDIVELEKKQTPSHRDSQYKVYADTLYAAMDGIGTDNDAIYRVFQAMKNDLDIAKLILAYGVKEDETLAEWIIGDLRSSQIDKLNKILSSKGITYKF